MSDKLPHERLREWANKAEVSKLYPSFCMVSDMVPDDEYPDTNTERIAFRKFAYEVEDAIESAYMDGTCHYFDMVAEEQGWPERKADELVEDYVKRCFIPRPRFEDGEPVQFGDRAIGEIVSNSPSYSSMLSTEGEVIAYVLDPYNGPLLTIELDNGDDVACQGVEGGYAFRRTAPKVLDADGVPIEVGDTVWRLRDSTKWHVDKTHPTEPRISVTQLDIEKTVTGGWFLGEGYTHREPDSLEKLRNEMLVAAKVNQTVESAKHDIEVFADRLTALIERGEE